MCGTAARPDRTMSIGLTECDGADVDVAVVAAVVGLGVVAAAEGTVIDP